MGRIGGGELLLILLIALLIFGPSKLADMGKGLGEGLKNFKKGLSPEAEAKNTPSPDPKTTPAAAKPPAAEPKPAPTQPNSAATETAIGRADADAKGSTPPVAS